MQLSNEVKKLMLTFTVFWAFLGLCALFYGCYEKWTVSESFFFAVVTMTTVGYGYKVPTDDNSRLFTIFVMIFGVFFVFSSINNAVATRLKAWRKTYMEQHHSATPTELYRAHQKSLFRTCAFIVVFLFIAAGVFCAMEDWTFIKGLYFAVQTATTIGFGDMDLRAGGTNVVLGIYIILSTTLIFFAFNHFSTLHEDFKRIKEVAALAEKRQALQKLKELDTGRGVTMDTFILAVLEQIGTVDREKDIEPWIRKFKEIDRNNSGTIDSHEIELFSQEEAARATQQLANLRTVTGGNKNVTVATIQEIGTNLMDALSMPLVGGSASSQRESFEEGDVHMHSVFSTRQNSSNNSNSALHAALVSSTMNSSSHGNNSSNSGVNQMHAQKVPTQSV